MKVLLSLLLLQFFVPLYHGFVSASTTKTAAVVLKDHTGAAASLFNNMRTPAALIGGAIVPLGLLNSPVVNPDDSRRVKFFKQMNILLAIGSLLSEILAITYATIAINKLAEITVAPTAGVAELISKHYELAWVGTNIHFLAGLFGFAALVGSKAWFSFGKHVGRIAGCWSAAALLQCISIVNRGIAMGHGEIDDSSARYAANLFTLSCRYLQLIVSHARGVLSITAFGLLIYSLVLVVKGSFTIFQEDRPETVQEVDLKTD